MAIKFNRQSQGIMNRHQCLDALMATQFETFFATSTARDYVVRTCYVAAPLGSADCSSLASQVRQEGELLANQHIGGAGPVGGKKLVSALGALPLKGGKSTIQMVANGGLNPKRDLQALDDVSTLLESFAARGLENTRSVMGVSLPMLQDRRSSHSYLSEALKNDGTLSHNRDGLEQAMTIKAKRYRVMVVVRCLRLLMAHIAIGSSIVALHNQYN